MSDDVYSEILIHVIISTKGRTPWITEAVAARLYPQLGTIVQAEKGDLYEVGGIEDHVHIYMEMSPEKSLSYLIDTIKARSAEWIRETIPSLGEFAWQEGYCCFTLDQSEGDALQQYIAGQAEHHEVEDFHSELVRILRENKVEFDEKDLHD